MTTTTPRETPTPTPTLTLDLPESEEVDDVVCDEGMEVLVAVIVWAIVVDGLRELGADVGSEEGEVSVNLATFLSPQQSTYLPP